MLKQNEVSLEQRIELSQGDTIELKWCVPLYHRGKLERYNVFNNRPFHDGVVKDLLEKDEKELCDDWRKERGVAEIEEGVANVSDYFQWKLRRLALWQFWGRCEYEMILESWPPCDNEKGYKLDVMKQLDANWDRFSEYVISCWREYHKVKREG